MNAGPKTRPYNPGPAIPALPSRPCNPDAAIPTLAYLWPAPRQPESPCESCQPRKRACGSPVVPRPVIANRLPASG